MKKHLLVWYLIDPEGIVQSETVNNLPIGRDIDDILRLLDAAIHWIGCWSMPGWMESNQA